MLSTCRWQRTRSRPERLDYTGPLYMQATLLVDPTGCHCTAGGTAGLGSQSAQVVLGEFKTESRALSHNNMSWPYFRFVHTFSRLPVDLVWQLYSGYFV
ncbi:unnamed protein product [Protopolystoma xenopodis]|uniref:Uncharacterized protein n=1 Tax=Protopolystoma xenopodis TaxID=117903 RepID=A0A448WUV5_9PLAT|nr:unnamed protein product [Protopolystoma xenopodis]